MNTCRLVKLLAVAVMALSSLLIAACATPLASTDLTDTDELPERYGVAVVQVINNGPRLTNTLYNWTGMVAVDITDPESRYFFRFDAKGLNGTRVFIGALPPGTYQFRLLQSMWSDGSASQWLNAFIPPSMGTFDVEHNQLTNLGVILYQQFGVPKPPPPGDVERNVNIEYVMTRMPSSLGIGDYVAARYPDFAAKSAGKAVLGWQADYLDEQRTEISRKIRSMAYGSEVVRLQSGFAIPAKLGMLHVRSSTGEWSSVDTGFEHEMSAFARHQQRFYLGGERGLVISAPSLQGPWTESSPLPADQSLVWLASVAGKLCALSRSEGLYRFLVQNTPDSEWNELRSWQLKLDGFFFTGNVAANVFKLADERVVVFVDGKREEWNAATGDWLVTQNKVIFDAEQQANGYLVAIAGNWFTGLSANPLYSVDAGVSWKRIRRVANVFRGARFTLPLVVDEETMFMMGSLVRKSEHRTLYDSEETYLLKGNPRLSPSLNEWETRSEITLGCEALLPSVSSKDELFSACQDGRILHSVDQGKNWVVDRGLIHVKDDFKDEFSNPEGLAL